ncbi:hypothetical protein [Falsiroseomonas sp. HW251]|uniref:hypothetical protein n=1 Tax=Falsiroseomonas sp. HW251 TaxID=3390998 RepID=UPI003D320CB5
MLSSIPAWLGRIGLSRTDIGNFGDDILITGSALCAMHRTPCGMSLGWERVEQDSRGRLRYSYPAGAQKGIVRSRVRDPIARRILLTCGPLPALCAQVIDGARHDTVAIGLGGCWTDASAEIVEHHVSAGAREIVLAFADHPAGTRSHDAAVAFIRKSPLGLERLTRRTPACRTWPETLQVLRSLSADGSAS